MFSNSIISSANALRNLRLIHFFIMRTNFFPSALA